MRWTLLTCRPLSEYPHRLQLIAALRHREPGLLVAELAALRDDQLALHLLTLLGCAQEWATPDPELCDWLGG